MSQPDGIAEMEQLSATHFEGLDVATLARRLRLRRVELFERVTSTLDVAHAIARENAPAGTLVLAEEQTSGRGRAGRAWRSAPGEGLWLTMIERPADTTAIEVLSLRIGIALAPLLDRFAGMRVSLKWPNDLYLEERKLAGTLIEARWRGDRPDWVAIGFGLNVVAPTEIPAAGLAKGVARLEVLDKVVRGIRDAAAVAGPLTPVELQQFAERDMARGRRCSEPVVGTVQGIDSRGALLIDHDGVMMAIREGSLVLEAQ